MPGLKTAIRSAVVIFAFAAGIGLAPVAGAAPVGPCEDVPYVGVCVPVSDNPNPRPQQSYADIPVAPDGGIGSIN